MYQALKEKTYKANMAIKKSGLVLFTWGNVSVKDDTLKVVAIKPSGVAYETMTINDIVVVDFAGNIVEGEMRPSVDLPSHLALYKTHPEIGAIVHTHSTFATAWAQKGRAIPMYGTTHADYFSDDIPCADYLSAEEMQDYEKNTGVVIAKLIKAGHANELPAAIVKGHGAFAWGKNAKDAVYHAVVLEEVAKMAYLTEAIPGPNKVLPKHIRDTHYTRKHGPNASYGQKKK
jgi:L-ribulose-5-phosphate 4-epimerase